MGKVSSKNSKNKKALNNKNVGGDTDISAITYTITTPMTHMSFTHHTLMGVQQDITILNRYGIEHNVEEQHSDPTTMG